MAEEKGVWRTVAGRRIFIRDGESLSESMKRSGKFKGSLSKAKTLKKNDPIKDFNNDVDKKIEELSKDPDAYKKLGEYANELRHIRNKDIEDNDMYEAYTRAYDRVIDRKDKIDKNNSSKTTSKDDSYAYTKNWSKEDAEKYIASQLKNNEGHDSVLLEKDGHYDVAKNWKEAEDAIKNHGWKHEKEDVDKIRRMAGLDRSDDEKKYSNGRTEKIYEPDKKQRNNSQIVNDINKNIIKSDLTDKQRYDYLKEELTNMKNGTVLEGSHYHSLNNYQLDKETNRYKVENFKNPIGYIKKIKDNWEDVNGKKYSNEDIAKISINNRSYGFYLGNNKDYNLEVFKTQKRKK